MAGGEKVIYGPVAMSYVDSCSRLQCTRNEKLGAPHGIIHCHSEGKIASYGRREGAAGAVGVFSHDLIGLVADRLILALEKQEVRFYTGSGSVASFQKNIAASHAAELRRLTVRIGFAGKLTGLVDIGRDDERERKNPLDKKPNGIRLKKDGAGSGNGNGINHEKFGPMMFK